MKMYILLFESGAQQITGGTIAVKNPELFLSWLNQYGKERIILGADFKEGKIAISGWQEQSDQELMRFLEDLPHKRDSIYYLY